MAKRNYAALALIFAIAAVFTIVGGCPPRNGDQQARITQLERENTNFRTENQQLQERVGALEAEIAKMRDPEQITRQPREGWEEYFPGPEETTLAGETTSRVRELLGEPPVLIRQIAASPEFNREIWVYMPFEEDPTGLYLFFKGNQLTSSRKDEFPGLYNAGLLDVEEFWQQ